MIILAIESSCDETAAALVKDQTEILSNVVSTQIDIHKSFGGVIPEVASRLHVEQISSVIGEAIDKSGLTMDDVDAIAYTKGPGLVGCLHVGAIAAKTLSWYWNKPLIAVHHLAGHIYANCFVTQLKFPLLALVVSGGNSELVYMKQDYDFDVIGKLRMMPWVKRSIKFPKLAALDIPVVRSSINWRKKAIMNMIYPCPNWKVDMIFRIPD